MNVDELLKAVRAEAAALGIPCGKDIDPHVRLNKRAVCRFGCCTKGPGGYVIEVSARLLNGGEQAVRETLAHELLHTCWGCRNHGTRWRAYAQRMNEAYGYHISRTGSWEALGLEEQRKTKHLVVCQKCGREFRRARASSLVQHPERYRCRCGGTLHTEY